MVRSSDPQSSCDTWTGIVFLILLVVMAVLGKLEIFPGQNRPWLGYLLFVLFLILLVFALVLIRLRTQHFVTTDTKYFPFEPRLTRGRIRQRIEETTEQLTARGFELCGHYQHAGHVRGVTGLVSLLHHPDSKAMARLIFAIGRTRETTTLAFVTCFTDGTELATTNVRRLSGLPQSEGRTIVWLPGIVDAVHLHAIHEEVVDHLNRGNKRQLLAGDPAQHLRETALREVGRWAARGYYYVNRTGDRYRLSWKGALASIWFSLWPGQLFLRMKRRGRTAAFLRDLGIDTPARGGLWNSS